MLTTLGAFDMMELSFAIGIPQVTGMPMNCLKPGKEISNSKEER